MKHLAFLFCMLLAGFGEDSFAGAEELAWHDEKEFRWATLNLPKQGKTGFTLLAPEQTGVTFTNSLEEQAGAANRVLYNGSGLAAGDYDNDGLPDIYFCSLNGKNALYKNLGNWRFKDVTKAAGLAPGEGYYRGAVFADINGDGFLDLLVARLGSGVLCFLNDGHGKFTDATQNAGTGSKSGSATLALADVDGNRTLDLYIANNRTDDIRDRGHVDLQLVRGQIVIPPQFKDRLVYLNGQLLEYGEPDLLLLNDGHGKFTPRSWTDGTFRDEAGKKLTNAPLDWGLTATFRDINGDGHPDLYVCNDFWTPDRIWLNDGTGHFRALDKLALRCISASSMGVDFADIDRDGYLDFFVVDMLTRDLRLRKRQLLAQRPDPLPIGAIDNRPQIMRNTLFLNRGDGTYAEIANFSRVDASEWSWQPVFLDIDLDGYEDLLITTGHAKDVQDADAEALIRSRQRPGQGSAYLKGTRQPLSRQEFTAELMEHMRLYPRLDTQVVAFRNLGNLQFEDVTQNWGTAQLGIHHAIAMADFDNDGDLDFVVNNLGSVAGIYRNDTVAPRVAVRLKGLAPNTQGIGSKLKLLNGAVPMQNQEVISGGRYLSGSDPMLVFAAGNSQAPMTLEVAWRSGRRSVVPNVRANRVYEVAEASAIQGPKSKVQSLSLVVEADSARRNKEAATTNASTLFRDVSNLLGHIHHDDPFNDFDRQPLLPKKLSQLGPGVSWFDLNGDGHDDLIIGTGKGGQLAAYRNDGHGKFTRMTMPPINTTVTRDQTGLVALRKASGQTVILAGSANYEDGLTVGSSVRQYDLTNGRIDDTLPGQEASTGPLALADLDGDGNLDLFVGGRVIPGRYPEAASSRVYRGDGENFRLDAENSRLLEKVGLVSGAVWSDLDGDGFPELILACEWGPLKVFRNANGKLAPWNPAVARSRTALSELGTQNSPVLRSSTAEGGEVGTLNQLTGWWNSVATGDLDGDGKLDVVVGNWGLNSSYHPASEQPLTLYYGDLAGRGTVDLIETDYDALSKAYAPRRNLIALSAAMPFLRERFASHRAFSEATIASALAERMGRGREVRAETLASMILLNRGDRFEAHPLPHEAQFAPAFSMNVADCDGDGNEDIFVSQNFFANQPETPRSDAGIGVWLRGDGTGQLKAVPGYESGIRVYGEQRGAAVGDFNEDGRIDLVVAQNGAATRLFENVAAKPGLRVRLTGPPGNPTGVGVTLRLRFGQQFGPAREIHAGAGYCSQDSAVQILGTPKAPTHVWVRWIGGKTTSTELPPGVREVTIDWKGALTKAI